MTNRKDYWMVHP